MLPHERFQYEAGHQSGTPASGQKWYFSRRRLIDGAIEKERRASRKLLIRARANAALWGSSVCVRMRFTNGMQNDNGEFYEQAMQCVV